MATRTPTRTRGQFVGDNTESFQWSGLQNGDDGEPMTIPGAADRSVQVAGTFGSGGSVSLVGSNDGANWVVLRDPQGNLLTFTAAGLKAVLELTAFVKPNVTAGDGSTALTMTVLAKRN